MWLAGIRLPIAAVVLVFALSIVLTIVPGAFQSYWVKPDELKLESRYISSNIEFTRYGFGLDQHHRRAVPGERQTYAGRDRREPDDDPEHSLVGPAPTHRIPTGNFRKSGFTTTFTISTSIAI